MDHGRCPHSSMHSSCITLGTEDTSIIAMLIALLTTAPITALGCVVRTCSTSFCFQVSLMPLQMFVFWGCWLLCQRSPTPHRLKDLNLRTLVPICPPRCSSVSSASPSPCRLNQPEETFIKSNKAYHPFRFESTDSSVPGALSLSQQPSMSDSLASTYVNHRCS